MECSELGWIWTLGGEPALGVVKVGVWGPGLPAARWACGPSGRSPCWLSACRDEPSCPWNSCEELIELSLNRYRLWLLVEAWSSLQWHLFIQWPDGVGHCGLHSLCGKASGDLEGCRRGSKKEALVGEAQRKHRRLGLDGVTCFCRHLAP